MGKIGSKYRRGNKVFNEDKCVDRKQVINGRRQLPSQGACDELFTGIRARVWSSPLLALQFPARQRLCPDLTSCTLGPALKGVRLWQVSGNYLHIVETYSSLCPHSWLGQKIRHKCHGETRTVSPCIVLNHLPVRLFLGSRLIVTFFSAPNN